MKSAVTWEDIYNRAIDKGCGSPELRAKDEARWQITQIMLEQGINPDEADCPEECIEDFMNDDVRDYLFDENGNLVSAEND